MDYGKGKTVRERLDEVMESLSEITKNRISSAIEDLIAERLKAERFVKQ